MLAYGKTGNGSEMGTANGNNNAPIGGAVSSLQTDDKCALSLLLYCALVVILYWFL